MAKYGFLNKEEAGKYSTYIVMQCLRKGLSKLEENDGFRNAQIPEEVLSRYSLKNFRQN